jgi:hypothetical protein
MGELAELKPKRQRLEVECDSLRDSLRRILPPHVPPAELDGEKIVNTAIALNTSLVELAGVLRMINVLNQQLGT